MPFEILLASPRGFCAGVDRAIEIVELALEVYGKPVYVRHEIVHNRHVVGGLRRQGAIFTENLAEVPEGSLLIFSAHGISPAVRREAEQRKLRTLDATCPLVTKVHVEALRYARDGFDIVLVGHRGHVEVEGTLGHAPGRMHLVETIADVAKLEIRSPDKLAVVTQTTLSVDDTREIIAALRARFPNIRLPGKDDICYATQNRQNAVKALTERCDVVLVVGATSSSNSNRLVEVAAARGARAQLVEDAQSIDPRWLEGSSCVGVTAGASTPEFLVKAVTERLVELGGRRVESLAIVDEGVRFTLPPELKRGARFAAPGE
ncbi:MAG: 4-hydroxy-3-methylbut-2-enyl diphosphate reductase [Deltaproteobacteria bacterium]|nr:4-hydroxy-3-methylbut-2-enyl diphosphate reductase [Deltaproteobacteria bacterium]